MVPQAVAPVHQSRLLPVRAPHQALMNSYPNVIRITYYHGEGSVFCPSMMRSSDRPWVVASLALEPGRSSLRHCNERGHAGELLEQHCKDPADKDGTAC